MTRAKPSGTWTWVSQPAPVSGSSAYQSEIVAGAMCQHFFDGAAAESRLVMHERPAAIRVHITGSLASDDGGESVRSISHMAGPTSPVSRPVDI